jgi:hypothetical protein
MENPLIAQARRLSDVAVDVFFPDAVPPPEDHCQTIAALLSFARDVLETRRVL